MVIWEVWHCGSPIAFVLLVLSWVARGELNNVFFCPEPWIQVETGVFGGYIISVPTDMEILLKPSVISTGTPVSP